MNLYEIILDCIGSSTGLGEKINLINADESLSNYGLNSMKTMEIVVELEKKLHIKFDDEDLLFANFDSISTMYEAVKNAYEKTMVQKGANE